jgi:hypothetical protein
MQGMKSLLVISTFLVTAQSFMNPVGLRFNGLICNTRSYRDNLQRRRPIFPTTPAMSAGVGFGEPRRKLKLAYGGASNDPIEQQKKWEIAYKAFISRMGKYLTAMSWEGHKRYGKGAIYANSQVREPLKRGDVATKWQKFGGVPTLYVPREQYVAKDAQSEQELKDLQQIISRIDLYNAEREFVVVFEAGFLFQCMEAMPYILTRMSSGTDGCGSCPPIYSSSENA